MKDLNHAATNYQSAPWYGIGALFAIIVLAIGQLLILYFANNKTNYQWPSWDSPNVCLSTLNNVATLFLTYAIVNGIAIAWWRKAMNETSMAKLHKSWAFSASFLSILREISHFNAIALAALMAKVAVIDGVLFQRAIGTEVLVSWNDTSSLWKHGKNLTVTSRIEFPITGSIGRNQDITAETDADFGTTVYMWLSTGDGINTFDSVYACEGVGCVYNVLGVGFAIDCNDRIVDDAHIAAVQAAGSGNKTIFSVDWTWNVPTNASSSLTMSLILPTNNIDEYGDVISCPVAFTMRQCELRPAIVNYTVAYTNPSSETRGDKPKSSGYGLAQAVGSSGSQLTYSCFSPSATWLEWHSPYDTSISCGRYDATSKQVMGVNVVKELTIKESRYAGANSSLGGIFNALHDQFSTKAELQYDNASWSVAQTGSLVSQVMNSPPSDSSYCNYSFFDPTPLIWNRLNSLMLMTSTSYLMPYESNIEVYPSAIQYYRDIYYVIDFKFSFIAIGLTVLVVLCVLPTYWQFWILGREVTLGPLEVANAFRVPAFNEEQVGHHDFGTVIKAIGHKKLRYQHATEPGQQAGFHIMS